jgi:shikimate 5-dehydrogenase
MCDVIQATENAIYVPAAEPTLYFIGVSTGNSSIMSVFPRWAEYLGLSGAAIKGIDFRLHDKPESYRRAVRHIKSDPLSRGALVTTHKIDLFNACRDLFDELDIHAKTMGEVSSISKRHSRLIAHAKDPITSGLALEAFLPRKHWEKSKCDALIFGAGGAATALSCYLIDKKKGANRPQRILISDVTKARLEKVHQVHVELESVIPIEYHLIREPRENDELMATLPAHSVVVNATGLGKDQPGSPVTDRAVFPSRGFVWDFNYRGDLLFLSQARAQQTHSRLCIENGWVYFLHGWTRVIAEVFQINIPTSGELFDTLSSLAQKS